MYEDALSPPSKRCRTRVSTAAASKTGEAFQLTRLTLRGWLYSVRGAACLGDPTRVYMQGHYVSANRTARAQLLARQVSCQGILDSYRQSKAASKVEAERGTEPSKLPEYNSLIFESADEDTCPAECVEEVLTPADFKAKCEVGRSDLS